MQTEAAEAKRSFQAQAEVAVADPETLIAQVFEHLVEHGAEITPIEQGSSATFFLGEVSMQARPNNLLMRVKADDETGLAFMKSLAARHLIEFVEGERPRFAWTGDGVGLSQFPNFREMTVERIIEVTPHMRRITLSGSDLGRYATHGPHLMLFVPPEDIAEPEWPVPGEDGLPIWPVDAKRPQVRTYTVRNLDLKAGTIDVDFVVHGDHGVGSRWALNARPGDVIGVRGPTGRSRPEADWYLLVGDETALPVIFRTLESLPVQAKGVAIIEVSDESEQQPTSFNADVEIRWLHRNGKEPGTTSLLVDAVRAVEMPPTGTRIYAMAGVEYAAFNAIRRYWQDELQLNKKDILPVAYWRRGRAEGETAPDDKPY